LILIFFCRAAEKHFKASKIAYVRKAYNTANELSKKAWEERIESERLHSIAAEKILNLKNNKNSIWILDLHGLHVSEALKAIEERLVLIGSIYRPKSGSKALLVITGTFHCLFIA
jgi:hypothetical protein